MQQNYKDTLLELLTTINYPNNKEKFIAEFEDLNRVEVIANILEKLPKDIQEKIQAGDNDYENIKKYIHQDEYLAEITKVSAEALKKFIEVISPLLTLQQKQQVDKIVHNYPRL